VREMREHVCGQSYEELRFYFYDGGGNVNGHGWRTGEEEGNGQ